MKSRNHDIKAINNEDNSPSLKSDRCPKVELFVEMLHKKLLSLVWSCHVGGPASSNMAVDKQCKHLELTLAM